jgi:hypothetical protein
MISVHWILSTQGEVLKRCVSITLDVHQTAIVLNQFGGALQLTVLPLTYFCFVFILNLQTSRLNLRIYIILLASCPSVHPSVHKKQLGSQSMDFDDIWYLSFFFFRKPVEEIRVPLKCDKNNGYFTWRRFQIYENTSLNYSQNEKHFKHTL